MPTLLLLLLYPVFELWFLIKIGGRFGIGNTLFALIAIAVLGAGLARTQGRYVIQKLQMSLSRGEVPTSEVIQALLIFAGGILFLIPGFISDFVAIFMVLPGTRHMLGAFVRARLQRQMRQAGGSFRVFTNGRGGGFSAGFKTYTRTSRGPDPSQQSVRQDENVRDVSPKVIDVKPVSSKTIEHPDSDQ